jgi:hypothetical protein
MERNPTSISHEHLEKLNSKIIILGIWMIYNCILLNLLCLYYIFSYIFILSTLYNKLLIKWKQNQNAKFS